MRVRVSSAAPSKTRRTSNLLRTGESSEARNRIHRTSGRTQFAESSSRGKFRSGSFPTYIQERRQEAKTRGFDSRIRRFESGRSRQKSDTVIWLCHDLLLIIFFHKPSGIRGNVCHSYADIVQSKEWLICNQRVGGSSPSVSSTDYRLPVSYVRKKLLRNRLLRREAVAFYFPFTTETKG